MALGLLAHKTDLASLAGLSRLLHSNCVVDPVTTSKFHVSGRSEENDWCPACDGHHAAYTERGAKQAMKKAFHLVSKGREAV